MAIDSVGPVGLTVPPPQEASPVQEEIGTEEAPEAQAPQSAPLPPYEGTRVDETA